MREIVLGAEPTLIFQATSQDLSIAALEAEEHNVPFRRKQAQQWNCHQKGGDTVLCSALPRFCCATPSQVRLGNVTHGQPRSRDIVANTGGVMFWVLYLMIFPGELAIFTGLNAERERHQSTKDAWMCPIWHKALKTKKNGPSRCHPSWRHHENQSLPWLCLLPNRLIHDTRQPLERVLLSSQETHMEQQAHLQTCRVWERSSLTFSNSNSWPTVQPESRDLVLD